MKNLSIVIALLSKKSFTVVQNENLLKVVLLFSFLTNCVSAELSIKLNILAYSNIIKNFQLAIKCEFQYAEEDKNYPEHIIDSLVHQSLAINNSIGNSQEFLCDDEHENVAMSDMLLDFFTTRLDSETTTSKVSSIEDDVSAESLCCTSSKTIHPKSLPSVKNNKLVTVVNHGEFSQSVTIEECTYVSAR